MPLPRDILNGSFLTQLNIYYPTKEARANPMSTDVLHGWEAAGVLQLLKLHIHDPLERH